MEDKHGSEKKRIQEVEVLCKQVADLEKSLRDHEEKEKHLSHLASFPDHPEWEVTYWDWTLTPIEGEEGTVEYLVFSLNDVSERIRAGIRLSAENGEPD